MNLLSVGLKIAKVIINEKGNQNTKDSFDEFFERLDKLSK